MKGVRGGELLTSEVWVVYLCIAEAGVVEDLELCLICFGDVREVFFVVGVDVFWVRSSFFVAHEIPFWCS